MPDVPEEFWRRINLVGEGALDYRLMLMTNSETTKRIATLPKPEQTKILDEGVELLLDGGDTLKVRPENLTKQQTDQVFTAGRVNNPAQQRAVIEDKVMKEAIKRETEKLITCTAKFTLYGGGIQIKKPCTLSKEDVKEMNRLLNIKEK